MYETIKDFNFIKFGSHLFRSGGGGCHGRMLIVLGGYVARVVVGSSCVMMRPRLQRWIPRVDSLHLLIASIGVDPLSIDLDLRFT